jgi:MFS family permease
MKVDERILVQLSPDEQRPRAVALYQTAVFGSAVLGPLIGGFLADVVSFQFIFGVSGVGRIAGMGLFLWLAARPALRSGKGVPVFQPAVV